MSDNTFKALNTKKLSRNTGHHNQTNPLTSKSLPCKICVFDKLDSFVTEHWDLDSLGCPMICFYEDICPSQRE